MSDNASRIAEKDWRVRLSDSERAWAEEEIARAEAEIGRWQAAAERAEARLAEVEAENKRLVEERNAISQRFMEWRAEHRGADTG